MQIFSSDKIVRSNTVQVLKVFNPKSSGTQVRKGEQQVSMMPDF